MGQAVSRRTLSWVRRLVADLPPRRPMFDARKFHVKCLVGKVALGQVRVLLIYIAYKNSLPTSQKT